MSRRDAINKSNDGVPGFKLADWMQKSSGKARLRAHLRESEREGKLLFAPRGVFRSRLLLAAKSASARGSAIWFVAGEDIYRFDLKSHLSR
jgi:hypothetical protein